jgi:hypothetical protein
VIAPAKTATDKIAGNRFFSLRQPGGFPTMGATGTAVLRGPPSRIAGSTENTIPPSSIMPAKKTATKKAKKPAVKPVKKTAAKKTARAVRKTARKTIRKAAAKTTKTAVSTPARPTINDVATAAYYKHLHRRAAGLPDDPAADWYEAERELHRRK